MSDKDTPPASDMPAVTPQASKPQSVKGTKGDQAREARIKAALKANIARRKQQARGRATDPDTES